MINNTTGSYHSNDNQKPYLTDMMIRARSTKSRCLLDVGYKHLGRTLIFRLAIKKGAMAS